MTVGQEEEEGESLGLFGVHISSAAHTPYSYDIPGVSPIFCPKSLRT